jgi:hypothetical protein
VIPSVTGTGTATPQAPEQERQFRAGMQRLEELLAGTEAVADPEARALTQSLVRAVLEIHAVALQRLLDLARGQTESNRLIETLAVDPIVSQVLALHDLHPRPVPDRVIEALDRLEPKLRAGDCTVKLVAIREGVARLRVAGESGPAIKRSVEEAVLEAVPELSAVAFEQVEDDGRVLRALPVRP